MPRFTSILRNSVLVSATQNFENHFIQQMLLQQEMLVHVCISSGYNKATFYHFVS